MGNPFFHAAVPPGVAISSHHFWVLGVYRLSMFRGSISGSIWEKHLHDFSIVFWNMFLGCFVLCFSFDLGNPQSSSSYFGKTDSCLMTPLLRQIRKSMISGFLLAFYLFISMFPRDWFCMFSGMVFL